MATNKHAQIRYHALDNCFRNPGKHYYILDLIEACNKALYDQVGILDGVKERQIRQDIADMESIWNIPLEKHRDGRKVYYRYNDLKYSINNQPLNETEINQLKQTIYMLNRFKGMPQFGWMEEILARLENTFKLKGSAVNAVGFEHNPYLKGLSYFSDIFNAVVNEQVLKIAYKKFGKDSTEMVFHPYFLKQYNNRWFLLGICEHLKEKMPVTILALDRIDSICETDYSYIKNDRVDFDEYFEDVIGVTVYADQEPKRILLEIDNTLFPYIETKPLHGSQKIKSRRSEATTIELNIIINYEFINLIIGYSDKVRIIEPEQLRNEIVEKAKQIITKNI